jgi:hypothetical protein
VHHIIGIFDVTLRQIVIEIVLIADLGFFVMENIQHIKGGQQHTQCPQHKRQHPEKITGDF